MDMELHIDPPGIEGGERGLLKIGALVEGLLEYFFLSHSSNLR